MRLLVQRVKEASVTVHQETVGEIGPGLLVLLGIHKNDNDTGMDWYIRKLLDLRIFSNNESRFDHSLQDIDGGILVVSQFTLYGTCTKGRRPEFTQSAPGEQARILYDSFVEKLRAKWHHVATGRFQAPMEVQLINDGPVTLIIER